MLDNADVTKQSKNENSPVPLGLKSLNCSPYLIGSSRSKLQTKLFTELISMRTRPVKARRGIPRYDPLQIAWN